MLIIGEKKVFTSGISSIQVWETVPIVYKHGLSGIVVTKTGNWGLYYHLVPIIKISLIELGYYYKLP